MGTARQTVCSKALFIQIKRKTKFMSKLQVIPVSEASNTNRYTHLFLVEREYFGFNTFESVVVE
jgi:hypothetical protein